jgi:ABC-type Zn uptake system ZnuABC Zn-binding protein ZnuA
MPFRTPKASVMLPVIGLLLSACASITPPDDGDGVSNSDMDKLNIVTGSTVVASLVDDITRGNAEITSLVPNSFDAHTYELKPSEAMAIETADVIFLADDSLNVGVSETAQNRKDSSTRLIDLNAETLDERDFLYIDSYRKYGKNPHTWTNLRYTWNWIPIILEEVTRIDPSNANSYEANAKALQKEINNLHGEIIESMKNAPKSDRKILVYHDAWEYFGKEYGVSVVGSLQAIDYSDPSPKQLAEIIEQIKESEVDVFYGSEVFPSDVLDKLSSETGAEYISDLSDDALPDPVGTRPYLYVELMRSNFLLIKEGIS